MPLCLAIARASGYPPIAGIWTAVIGGVLTSFVSNSQLTIKGPAAGLIVIVVGAVTELGAEFATPDMSDADKAFLGYKLALGIGVTAGVIQILFGLIRAGRLVDFFPLTPVHGMLASIGLIIIVKQVYEVLGAAPEKGAGPLKLCADLPFKLGGLNPEIAAIGLVSLLILFGLPLLAGRLPWLKKVPAQLVVLLVAIGLGSAYVFDLDHEHKYLFPGHFSNGDLSDAEYAAGPKSRVTIPDVTADPPAAFAVPDFRGLATGTGLQYLLLFTLIGSLESLLSAKAIELLDPWRRKTDFDRDLLAIGLANTLSSAVGGLPVISEIVRSKANIDNGARTRVANACHGLFLLAFVLLFPGLIHQIPLAALGAMLVYTGFRLASPREFVRTYKVGSEQFVVFIGTILVTLGTDLLIGIGAGIGLKVLFHLWHGAPLSGLLRADVDVVPGGDRAVVLVVRKAAVFSNWLGLRKAIEAATDGRDRVAVDVSRAGLVDHSVMEKLHELEAEFAERGQVLEVIGLELLTPLAAHPLAARKGGRAADQVPTAA
ncbi:MAG: SulP family inorganic anion transporter, partial [Gemmataceae bacterium]|nr:SulP family inorganic anion transporter [Gemmataceae bacterium]